MKKKCPLLMIANRDSNPENELNDCMGHKCGFWCNGYTTENISVSDCSIAMMPNMADGLYRV